MTSTRILLILFPASITSSTPLCVKGTSTHPVNNIFSLHNDSPWWIKIKVASPANLWYSWSWVENHFCRPPQESQTCKIDKWHLLYIYSREAYSGHYNYITEIMCKVVLRIPCLGFFEHWWFLQQSWSWSLQNSFAMGWWHEKTSKKLQQDVIF